MSNIFLFAGQGSQYYGMGSRLYNSNNIFKKQMDHFDSLYLKMTGESLLSELFNKKKKYDVFERLIYTHTAIYMFEYSLYKYLESQNKYPDVLIGSSLGEFVCMAVSGAVNPDNSFEYIYNQAKIIEEKCLNSFLCGLICSVRFFYEYLNEIKGVFLVSINSKKNIVIGGNIEIYDEVCTFLKKHNIPFVRLPVQYAFHTPCIENAKESINLLFDKYTFFKTELPYYSSFTCYPVKKIDSNLLWEVIRSPMDIVGVSEKIGHGNSIYDLSPGSTLLNSIKNNTDNRSNTYIAIDNRFSS